MNSSLIGQMPIVFTVRSLNSAARQKILLCGIDYMAIFAVSDKIINPTTIRVVDPLIRELADKR